MEENIILLAVITLVTFFIVGNPVSYAIMSKLTGLKIKNKTHHMILVSIHSVVMTSLMYVAYVSLVRDIDCPPPPSCPPQSPCAVCAEKEQADLDDSTDDVEDSQPSVTVEDKQPPLTVEGFSF